MKSVLLKRLLASSPPAQKPSPATDTATSSSTEVEDRISALESAFQEELTGKIQLPKWYTYDPSTCQALVRAL